MILRALYDYYNRCRENLPPFGLEEKQIGFLLVLNREGKFLRFEDCRESKDAAKRFLVKKAVGRTSGVSPNFLYDNSAYVFGYSEKDNKKVQLCYQAFKNNVENIANRFPDSKELKVLQAFYAQNHEDILYALQQDPLWESITKNLTKKFSFFSFRIDGSTKIVAEQEELLNCDDEPSIDRNSQVCLVTGNQGKIVEVTTSTMIPGSQAVAKLVAFQVNSGYDSYGKQQGGNAPISERAEFSYTTALKTMLSQGSKNKFLIRDRSFLFWASSSSESATELEHSLYNLFGYQEVLDDDPNQRVEDVKSVFKSIYSGKIPLASDERFYILGLSPNVSRLAVVYWADLTVKSFAEKMLRHFEDMEIGDPSEVTHPYAGLKNILSAVTLGGKVSDATPNLPEAVLKSMFEGTPYPYTLFAACIRRIRAADEKKENKITRCRVAILKAYLNRLNNNHQKINIMLDKDNTNLGYLCGRLFAVLDRVQESANGIRSIQERYMNAASSTPSTVFSTILNLSSHHAEKLSEGGKVMFEKLKQEIIDKIPCTGFPSHLDLQDQGRFFIGYYHQRQDFFLKKDNVTE